MHGSGYSVRSRGVCCPLCPHCRPDPIAHPEPECCTFVSTDVVSQCFAQLIALCDSFQHTNSRPHSSAYISCPEFRTLGCAYSRADCNAWTPICHTHCSTHCAFRLADTLAHCSAHNHQFVWRVLCVKHCGRHNQHSRVRRYSEWGHNVYSQHVWELVCRRFLYRSHHASGFLSHRSAGSLRRRDCGKPASFAVYFRDAHLRSSLLYCAFGYCRPDLPCKARLQWKHCMHGHFNCDGVGRAARDLYAHFCAHVTSQCFAHSDRHR